MKNKVTLTAAGCRRELPQAHPLARAITECLRSHGTSLACIVGFSAALATAPLQAATFTVTNTNDAGVGSLRQALQLANSYPGADQVTLSSVSGTLALTSGSLSITDSVTISGPGSDLLTIEGNLATPLIQVNVTDADITLSGLTLTRGAAGDSSSGAITCEMAVEQAGSTLTISDAVITGNVGFGIGVSVLSSVPYSTALIIISDSTISGNSAGGVIFKTFSNKVIPTLRVNQSTISGNSGPGLDGRSPIIADYYYAFNAQIDVQGSRILDNAGIGISSQCTAVSVNNSTIAGNGGGVRASGGFCSDLGPGATIITNSQISSNDGAGVEAFYFGHPRVLNSEVSGNRGDGVSLHTIGGSIVVESSRISGNEGVGVEEDGGDRYSSRCSVNNSTIDNNQGGGIGAFGYSSISLDISNSTISDNSGAFGVMLSSVQQGPLRILNSTISGNATDGLGHGVHWYYYFEKNAKALLENSIVAGNAVGSSGSDLAGVFTAAYSLIHAPGSATIHEAVAGSNLIGVDPGLGPLQDNGGPTPTHALLPGSPAIDRGDPGVVAPRANDQRGAGFSRVVNGRIDMGAFEVQGGPAAVAAVGTWRPGDSKFRLDANGNGRWDGAAGGDRLTAAFGLATDLPVRGDWNGDGIDDLGVRSPGTSKFALDTNGNGRWDRTAGGDLQTIAFGYAADLPVSGDWNGDGTDDIGVWRPSTRQFYLDLNGNDRWDRPRGGDLRIDGFGLAADLPVTGDWNGDGTDDIGVWRPSTGEFLLDANGNHRWDGVSGGDLQTVAFGLASDRPVSGDWNGDGKDDVGVWRPSTRQFRLDANGNHRWDEAAGGDVLTGAFGAATDVPLAGRW